jgi:hypothetical protein
LDHLCYTFHGCAPWFWLIKGTPAYKKLHPGIIHNHVESTIILIDGKKLTELMIENELGVAVKRIYKISKIDSDYFMDE